MGWTGFLWVGSSPVPPPSIEDPYLPRPAGTAAKINPSDATSAFSWACCACTGTCSRGSKMRALFVVPGKAGAFHLDQTAAWHRCVPGLQPCAGSKQTLFVCPGALPQALCNPFMAGTLQVPGCKTSIAQSRECCRDAQWAGRGSSTDVVKKY